MARMTGAERKLQTLDRVHTAALAEIAANGIAGASIDRLTEAAGYSRGAFYGNYKSKEELILRLMQQNAESELDNWRRLLANFVDVESFLRDIGLQFERYLTETSYGLFWVELSLHARRHPDFALVYDAYIEQILANLDAVLRLVHQTLNRPPPQDVRLISTAIRNLAQGSVLSAHDGKAAAILTLAVRRLLGL